MKLKFAGIISLLIIVLTNIFCFNASAMTTGFEVESVKSEEAEKIMANIKLSYENEESYFHSIKCFDISDNGLIAVGIDEDVKKYINIYDNNGIFKYCYSFEDYGTYGIEFDNDNLIIYTVRGDNAYLIDEKGKCLEICTIFNNSENDSYWNNTVFAKSKESGGNKYYLSKGTSFLNIFTPSYSQLVKVESDGTETVLFDVSGKSDVYIIIIIIIAIIVIGISIIVTVNYFSHAKQIK